MRAGGTGSLMVDSWCFGGGANCWCIDNTDIEERGPTLVAIMEVAECIEVCM